MSSEYLDLKFPEKIREFHKYDEQYFTKILGQASLSITKNMHPIIAYNYPNLVSKFVNPTDLSNVDRSPSIVLNHKECKLFKPEDIRVCTVFKNINDKLYSNEEINQVMDDIKASKRLRASFSKSYPQLHDKFTTEKDNYAYNMLLIALEHKDYDYVIDNFDYAKSKFLPRLKDEWPEVFSMLPADEYTDDDLLEHIDKYDLIHLVKHETTAIKFIAYHKTTVGYTIKTINALHAVKILGLDVDKIDYNTLINNWEFVIEHWPYFYHELITQDEEVEKLALKDPYNVKYVQLNDNNIKTFLNYSNTNVMDSHLGLEQSDYFEDNKERLLKEIDKFQGTFLALQTYPILIMLLSKDEYYKHVTPYLINHACKVDKNMFEFFTEMENNRWTLDS